jgi:formyltetrahydrofolate-dependent phosphoribosylglycinamide formyltransferase
VKPRVPVAVFASGGGTNLQALLDHEPVSGEYRVAVVISDREGAGALDRGRSGGREAYVIETGARPLNDVGQEMLERLADHDVQVILLAGYLKMIPPAVVAAYERRILNIHPALLPAFGGKGMYGSRVHEAVLASGVDVTGVTVHYVDEDYDTGTIVAQGSVPVRPGDDVVSLAARVLKVEHELYPVVADHVCRAVAEGVEPGPFDVTHFDFAPVTPHPQTDRSRSIEETERT